MTELQEVSSGKIKPLVKIVRSLNGKYAITQYYKRNGLEYVYQVISEWHNTEDEAGRHFSK